MPNLIPRVIFESDQIGERHKTVSGSVLLIDVEGSTRLASELAAQGTLGAERMAEALDAVFTPIVEEVSIRDGYVAQFTGDGAIAAFHGDLNAATGRALDAAMSLLRRFSAATDVQRLTVRAVVGSGDISWTIWTTDSPGVPQNRAFTFSGSALSEVQVGESLIAGGQIGAGPLASGYIGNRPRAQDLADGYCLIGEWDPEPSGAMADYTYQGDANGYFPSDLGSMGQMGEFREVVNVFVTVDTTDIDAGAIAWKLLDRIADRGGFLCDLIQAKPPAIGVTGYLMWGAPLTHENDVENAVRFVFDVQDVLGPERVKAGVTTAMVFAGFVGDDNRVAYTGVDSTVNLAARMAAEANWGEIRATALDPTRTGAMSGRLLGTFEYRGFDHPIPTYLLERHRRSYSTPDFHHQLFGRDSELSDLEEVVETHLSISRTAIVAVSGEAGIGKSHLLARYKAKQLEDGRSVRWMHSRADELSRKPYDPLRHLLEDRFGVDDTVSALRAGIETLASEVPDMSASLRRSQRALIEFLSASASATTELDPSLRFDNLVVAVGDLLRAESTINPVIVAISGGQWLDASTPEFVERVRDDLAEFPVVFVVETRVRLPFDVNSEIRLGGLSPTAIGDLTSEILDRDPSPGLVSLLTIRTAGNPFYVHELVTFMEEHDLLVDSDDGLVTAETLQTVPADLRRLLVARLDALQQRVKEMVMAASVVGADFDVRVVSQVLMHPERFDEDVGVVTNEGIWRQVSQIRYMFQHLILKDTAYEMHLHSTLASLHTAVAEAMERLYGTATARYARDLAFHFDRAGLGQRALPYYVRSGAEAQDHYANATSIELYSRALELLGDHETETRFDVLKERAAVYDMLGERDRQASDIKAMASLALDDSGRRVAVLQRRADLEIALGQYREALDTIDEALAVRHSGAVPKRIYGRLHITSAKVHRYLGDNESARSAAWKALEMGDQEGDTNVAAAAQDLLGGLSYDQGDYESAIESHQSASELFNAAGNVVSEISALNNLGSALFEVGQFTEAGDIHTVGLERSRGIGYRMGEGDHLDNRGGTAWAVGDYPAAIADYQAAFDIRKRSRDSWGMAISLANLGSVYRVIGDLEKARGFYEQSIAIDRSTSRLRGVAFGLHGLGLVKAAEDNLTSARILLEEALEIRQGLGETHLANESRVGLAEALFLSGEVVDAVSLVSYALDQEGEALFGAAIETSATILRCYRVLLDDAPDRANQILKYAYDRIRRRAMDMDDDSRRNTYVNDIPAHVEIQSLVGVEI